MVDRQLLPQSFEMQWDRKVCYEVVVVILICVVLNVLYGGVRGFYRGLTPPLVAEAVINSFLFGMILMIISWKRFVIVKKCQSFSHFFFFFFITSIM